MNMYPAKEEALSGNTRTANDRYMTRVTAELGAAARLCGGSFCKEEPGFSGRAGYFSKTE